MAGRPLEMRDFGLADFVADPPVGLEVTVLKELPRHQLWISLQCTQASIPASLGAGQTVKIASFLDRENVN